MSSLTVMTMMMILLMIRPGEGGTFCRLASQSAGRLAGRETLTLSAKKKLRVQPPRIFKGKNRKSKSMSILWHLTGAIDPTSILILIALFEFGLQKRFV